MSRLIDNDFKLLEQYIKNYNLKNLVADPNYNKVLKKNHKSALLLLTLWSNICFVEQKQKFKIETVLISQNSIEFQLLREAISDIISAMFCAINGAYKPAHMSLRSGIENLVRALTATENANAVTTTSVYELFEFAKIAKIFSLPKKKFLTNLHLTYKDLCKFTHTASLAHMTSVNALEHFPKFAEEQFSKCETQISKTIKNFLSLILLLAPNIYRDSHYKSKEILDLGIELSTRKLLLQVNK